MEYWVDITICFIIIRKTSNCKKLKYSNNEWTGESEGKMALEEPNLIWIRDPAVSLLAASYISNSNFELPKELF